MEARKAAIPGFLSKKQSSFTVDDGIGKDFRVWLNTPCGGGKSAREATQSAKRAMKFVMYCTGCNEVVDEIDNNFLDCCLGSASMIMDFLKALQDE